MPRDPKEEEEDKLAPPPVEEEDDDGERDEELGDDDELPEDDDGDADEDDEVPDEVDEPDEDEPDEDEDPKPEKKSSRRAERVRQLANETKLAKQRAERAERERDDARRIASNNTELNRQQAQYRAWYDTLDPQQQWMEDRRRNEETNQRQIASLQQQVMDTGDRARFERLLAKNPDLAQYEDEVETLLAQVRASGVNATREIILDQVIGQRTRQAMLKGKPVKKQQAATRMKKATTKPSKGVSDEPKGNRKFKDPNSIEALEARLKGVRFPG
jgi:hypothetical protein